MNARTSLQRRKAVFVAHAGHLGSSPGGVQRCTQEYIETLNAAGFDLALTPVREDRGWCARLSRQVVTNPYLAPISKHDLAEIRTRARDTDLVFVNQGFLAGAVVKALREVVPSPPVVLLSHGCEITDFLPFTRLRRQLPLSGRVRPTTRIALGSILAAEYEARAGVSAAVVLCQADAELERWYGVRHVIVAPRIIIPAAFDWRPITGRFGFVGTLDHSPNLDGLVQVLQTLSPDDDERMQVRIVGGPERLGAWIARTFPRADYLGPLDDDALRAEAATWQAFLHPIFLSARGASTKLAQPLAWGMPVLTTPEGRRGYQWREGGVTCADSPTALVGQMRRMLDDGADTARRDAVMAAARTAPSVAEVGDLLRRFVDEVRDNAVAAPAPEPTASRSVARL